MHDAARISGDADEATGDARLALIGKLAAILVPALMLAFSPPASMPAPAWRLAAVTAMMACLWLTQAIPIAVTSLVPLAAFPLLGIQSADVVSNAYVDKNLFLFLGGFIVALGVEKWGLHRRIALHVCRVLGTSLRRVVLGFMLATALLSMWISNTASTLLMLPIALALVSSLEELLREGSSDGGDCDLSGFATVLLLGIAYSASLGGLTTLVGTPTNVAFQGIWTKRFPPPAAPELSAGEWMAVWFPLGMALLLCAWGVLTCRLKAPAGAERLDRGFFRERLARLGRATRAERTMLAVFAVTAVLWITRKPLSFAGVTVLPGWGPALADALSGWGVQAKWIHDSTVAIGVAVLMFVIPARRDDAGRTQYLMDWKTAERLPWGILLLIGGGFALAGAFQSTGLAEWIGTRFAEVASDWPLWLLVAAVCFLLTFLTELTSNVATVSALLPILAAVSLQLEVDPRLLMLPACVSASCAFMLPIATPPNAIVFGSGRIRMGQMAAYGVVLNLIGVILITIATFALLVPQLGIDPSAPPVWAK